MKSIRWDKTYGTRHTAHGKGVWSGQGREEWNNNTSSEGEEEEGGGKGPTWILSEG